MAWATLWVEERKSAHGALDELVRVVHDFVDVVGKARLSDDVAATEECGGLQVGVGFEAGEGELLAADWAARLGEVEEGGREADVASYEGLDDLALGLGEESWPVGGGGGGGGGAVVARWLRLGLGLVSGRRRARLDRHRRGDRARVASLVVAPLSPRWRAAIVSAGQGEEEFHRDVEGRAATA